ncbi:RNA exonuclease NDAI_0G02750 [Naumovozyma dairenensis CBS 421]|uniref:RNA exonuclease 3 n=1 Tax=Naumovozyma dairenensis (strain ATCC 10597 / BCRC 20456 / CBS 421 / NBRC 0211 / NRRL Y-12639) TaxID=1071378 RepID=G0WE41_NAUDC|nr:hypothetical protein NDAI_0G02750 [Naumovozyma dairenensis CBS 421]CCD26052.2 hypothetical protein NDAI_0G02750 [Naumovozyma dairenensis CBS 421]
MTSKGTLRPIDLPTQPIGFQDRYKILHKLHTHLMKCKPRVPGEKLEKLAMQLEVKVAKLTNTSQNYRFTISVLLRDLTKAKGDLSKVAINGQPLIGPKRSKRIGADDITLITTKANAMEKLKGLLLETSVLEKHGYIVDTYSKSTKEQEVKTYTNCSRCEMKFEKSDILKKTVCRYHPSKKQFNRGTKVYDYPCCGETSASSSISRLGCKTYDYHVFRSESYFELKQISEFKDTANIEGESNVLALDCEMAFTSLGYEMVRLTIVNFFSKKVLFDEIIEPFGEIIDLNTQFSGVYESSMEHAISFKKFIDLVLSKSLINKHSILIGHGLENDLNVMRIIHNKIIDTAVLYSNGRLKTSLKNLAFEILSRKIQSGEHDSSEDAIATMDIVKKKLGISLTQEEWS